MDETCEIIPSQKGNDKINVRDYLMVKDRTCHIGVVKKESQKIVEDEQ